MIVVWIILAIIIVVVAIITINTIRFKPYPEPTPVELKTTVPEEKVTQDMVDMIRCKTVSNRDDSLVDWNEFEKFRNLLVERFPLVHEKATLEHLGKSGLLYHIKGEASDKPSVLMAHYDVVPVEQKDWTEPAFEGLIKDDCIWGRGTMDTKGTLCAIFEALEVLLADGYVPKQDLYLSFSGEEEIDGDSCPAIVKRLEDMGVSPAFVLDEGGAVVENVFPGVHRKCAVVGTSEKGSVNLDFTLSAKGGHASAPPVKSLCGKLADAITAIEKHPFKGELTPSVAGMFDTLGRYSSVMYRMLFSNLWCFKPVLDMICKKSGGELNAMMRSTVAITRMEGSKAYNVMPSTASFSANMRLLGSDTIESAVEYLNKVIDNDDIKISVVNGMNPSITSDVNCAGYENLSKVIKSTWPEAVVTPYLMMACSDSRHYCRITDKVYRFSAMEMSRRERAMIHGVDEAIPLKTLYKTVEFYERMMQML